jgi:membrane-associated protease RseP (regulator of RpoE activity)
MVDFYTLSVIAFFAVLGILIYRDRKNIQVSSYIVLMRRTKRFTDLLDRIAKLSPRVWRFVGTVAVVVCFFAMAYGTYLIGQTAYLVYQGVIDQPGLQIALPIPSSQMSVGPGFIGIPFWFWIVVIAVILIPHETFHGIISRAHNIRLKNVGLMLMAIIPGAFVEPDEKQLNKSRLMPKLRVFAAGTFINFAIGLSILFIVQSALWAPNVSGLLVTSVNQTSPAGIAGITSGTIIETIDGVQQTTDFASYAFLVLMVPGSNTQNITSVMSSLELYQTMNSYQPGDTISLGTNSGNYNITLSEHPEMEGFPYIGITTSQNATDPGMFNVTFPLLAMMGLLSIFVGLFNILPIYPLDGGLMVQAVSERLSKKKSKQVVKAISFAMFAILIYIIFGPYLIG